MMDKQTDRDAIADEATGQTHESAPPYAGKKGEVSPEEAAQRLAPSSGAQASTPEKTAESIGERVGDAYSDPASIALHPKPGPRGSRAGSRSLLTGWAETKNFSGRPSDGRLATVIAGFGLGYLTALLFHARISNYFGVTPGPFQITKPPRGDGHPRGFVQSTVLKTITEHPQGLTTAEIITELGPEGIGRASIANALGALVQAKKISSQGVGGKYLPAAAEVPTAPDQPSP